MKYDKELPFITKKIKHLGMIAGGSGIAPLYQIAKTMCLEDDASFQIRLIFSNHVILIRLRWFLFEILNRTKSIHKYLLFFHKLLGIINCLINMYRLKMI